MARLARLAYGDMDTRVQPLPNNHKTNIYQIHIRPRVANTREDLDWVLVEQGYAEQVEKSLKFKARQTS